MFRQAAGVHITAVATDKISITLDELIGRYELANRADGKSEKTVKWYDDMLRSFLGYVEGKRPCPDLSAFSIDTVRGYILDLRQRRKFARHTYTPRQEKLWEDICEGRRSFPHEMFELRSILVPGWGYRRINSGDSSDRGNRG